MNLLCPACHTPLPAAAAASSEAVVACPACSAEIDVSRAGTQAGRPRFVPEIDRTGSVLGGFRIEGLIGGGGMGTVYRATAPDGTHLALKVLAPALAAEPAFVARFAREVEALARLDHPAIVRVLANGTDAGAPWFAMELCDGPDLKTRLGSGPLGRDDLAAIFGRLFEALDHAHARAVVHRDLKPANVLLAASGAKLADFGIARFEPASLARSQALTRLTETAVVIGSLPYMSPEQKRGGSVDGRSDLFSAGVMLYEAATRTLPQGAFAPPSELDPRLGRAFDALVMRLLHPDPSRRPASAAEAGRALAAATAARGRGRTFVVRAGGAAALTLVALFATMGGWTALRRGRVERKVASAPTQALAPPDAPVVGAAERTVSNAAAPPNPEAILGQTEGQTPNGVPSPGGSDATNAGQKTTPWSKSGRYSSKFRLDLKVARLPGSASQAKSKTRSNAKLMPAPQLQQLAPLERN